MGCVRRGCGKRGGCVRRGCGKRDGCVRRGDGVCEEGDGGVGRGMGV